MYRNLLPGLVAEDKMEADELLNNYTATQMTSEDDMEAVTLPVFQNFQVRVRFSSTACESHNGSF
jgi:hypothetical protein